MGRHFIPGSALHPLSPRRLLLLLSPLRARRVFYKALHRGHYYYRFLRRRRARKFSRLRRIHAKNLSDEIYRRGDTALSLSLSRQPARDTWLKVRRRAEKIPKSRGASERERGREPYAFFEAIFAWQRARRNLPAPPAFRSPSSPLSLFLSARELHFSPSSSGSFALSSSKLRRCSKRFCASLTRPNKAW